MIVRIRIPAPEEKEHHNPQKAGPANDPVDHANAPLTKEGRPGVRLKLQRAEERDTKQASGGEDAEEEFHGFDHTVLMQLCESGHPPRTKNA